jgi:hypothetical protein
MIGLSFLGVLDICFINSPCWGARESAQGPVREPLREPLQGLLQEPEPCRLQACL